MNNTYEWTPGYDFWLNWNETCNLKSFDKQIISKDDDLTIKIALPGVSKEDIEISSEKNYLTVKCTSKEGFVEAQEESWYLRDYNLKDVKTSLVNGVLSLELSKKDEAKPVIIKLE